MATEKKPAQTEKPKRKRIIKTEEEVIPKESEIIASADSENKKNNKLKKADAEKKPVIKKTKLELLEEED